MAKVVLIPKDKRVTYIEYKFLSSPTQVGAHVWKKKQGYALTYGNNLARPSGDDDDVGGVLLRKKGGHHTDIHHLRTWSTPSHTHIMVHKKKS